MAIVSSRVVGDYTDTVRCPTHNVTAQRRNITERHVDSAGIVYERTYSTDQVDADPAVALAAYAEVLGDQLQQQEILENLEEVLS